MFFKSSHSSDMKPKIAPSHEIHCKIKCFSILESENHIDNETNQSIYCLYSCFNYVSKFRSFITEETERFEIILFYCILLYLYLDLDISFIA